MPSEEKYQKKKKQEPIGSGEIQRHLADVQTWETRNEIQGEAELSFVRSSYAAQIMMEEEQKQLNARFRDFAQGQLPQAEAQEAAPGAPQVMVPPVKKGRKQRRREEKITRDLQKQHPMCDYTSYKIQEELQKDKTAKVAVFTPEMERRCQSTGTDKRVLRAFMHGCRMKNGKPLNAREAARLQEDRQFIADYISGKSDRRQPHLRRIVDEVLQIRLTPEMLTKRYIEEHPAEIKNMGDKLTYFSNVRNDPRNASFFNRLSPLELAALDAQESMGAAMGTLYVGVIQYNGVDPLNIGYLPADTIRAFRQADVIDEGAAQTALEQRNQAFNTAVQHAAKQRMEQIKRGRLREMDEQNGENGVGPGGYVTQEAQRYLSRSRNKIQADPRRYAASRRNLDDLYQRMFRTAGAWDELRLQAEIYKGMAEELKDADGAEGLVGLGAQKNLEQTQKEIEAVHKRMVQYDQMLSQMMGD